MPSENTPKSPGGQSAADQSPVEKNEASTPSGYKGDNPATAGTGETNVQSTTPENRLGHLNPSAPEDSNTTPGTVLEK